MSKIGVEMVKQSPYYGLGDKSEEQALDNYIGSSADTPL